MKNFILTGGIASGKSLATKYFANLCTGIIDTDEIAKHITSNNGIAIPSLIKAFGNTIIDNDGSMNREKMRELIFNDIDKKLELEQILHPMIKIQALQKIQYLTSIYTNLPYILLVVPLFLSNNESHNFWLNYSHGSICLYSDYALRLQRLMHRNIPAELANKIISQQPSNQEYIQNCTYNIENNSNVSDLEQKIYDLHNILKI